MSGEIIDPTTQTLKHTGDTELHKQIAHSLTQSDKQKTSNDAKYDAGRINTDNYSDEQLRRASSRLPDGYQTRPNEKIFGATGLVSNLPNDQKEIAGKYARATLHKEDITQKQNIGNSKGQYINSSGFEISPTQAVFYQPGYSKEGDETPQTGDVSTDPNNFRKC